MLHAPSMCNLKFLRKAISMKTLQRCAVLGSLFLVPLLAHAQSGCTDSPECPTAILGVVGAAAVALYTRLRSR